MTKNNGFQGQSVSKGPRKRFERSLTERLLGTEPKTEESNIFTILKSYLCD